MNASEPCPCGSSLAYSACCEPIIRGTVPAPTAEALMRARYSAYAKTEIDFIGATQGGDNADLESTRKWSLENEWRGLKIVRTEKGGPDDETGVVEFVATYANPKYVENHHEVSQFVRKDGKWMFESGEVIPAQVVRSAPKIGRNDPCHCGSGKKFKVCHGRA